MTRQAIAERIAAKAEQLRSSQDDGIRFTLCGTRCRIWYGSDTGIHYAHKYPLGPDYIEKMARIVDGSDGRTYIAEYTTYGFISIMRGDMKFQQEAIFERDPRYAEALELFA